MAISSVKNSTALVLRFEKGQNLDGTKKVVSQKFSKVNKEATDDDLFSLGSAIGEVLVSAPVELKRVEEFSLMEEDEEEDLMPDSDGEEDLMPYGED